VLAAPAPILGNVVGNQLITAQVLGSFVTTFGQGFIGGLGDVPPALQAAVGQILAGDISGGVQAVASAVLAPVLAGAFGALGQLGDITAVLQNPFLNIANVIGTVVSINTLIGLGLPLLTEALAPVFQLASTAQAIFDGVRTGNLEGVANALISFPSDMVGTILNGSAAGGNNAGILTSPYGLFAGLLALRQSIADAITPPVLAPAPFARTSETTTETGITSIPDVAGSTLPLKAPSVDVDPVAGKVGEVEVDTLTVTEPVIEKTVEETVVDKSPVVELVKEKTPDTRVDTTNGNKAEPGVVNAGVSSNGSSTTPPATPEDSEPDADPGTTTGANAPTGDTGSDTGDGPGDDGSGGGGGE
jgi:hypothetical protein